MYEGAVEAHVEANTEEEVEALRKMLRRGKIDINPIPPVEKVTGDECWEADEDEEHAEEETGGDHAGHSHGAFN